MDLPGNDHRIQPVQARFLACDFAHDSECLVSDHSTLAANVNADTDRGYVDLQQ